VALSERRAEQAESDARRLVEDKTEVLRVEMAEEKARWRHEVTRADALVKELRLELNEELTRAHARLAAERENHRAALAEQEKMSAERMKVGDVPTYTPSHSQLRLTTTQIINKTQSLPLPHPHPHPHLVTHTHTRTGTLSREPKTYRLTLI
jgi:hypothetical protein